MPDFVGITGLGNYTKKGYGMESRQNDFGTVYYDIFRQSYVQTVKEHRVILECQISCCAAERAEKFGFRISVFKYDDRANPQSVNFYPKAVMNGDELKAGFKMIDIVSDYFIETISQYAKQDINNGTNSVAGIKRFAAQRLKN